MSVKHTVHLSREQAEQRYVDLYLRVCPSAEGAKHRLQGRAMTMGDKTLEDHLERLNDMANDGEGFENYLITRNP